MERELPNQIAFGARVVPEPGQVRMELWLRNGTAEPLTGLSAQVCVMLKGADGFNAQTGTNKVIRSTPWRCAARTRGAGSSPPGNPAAAPGRIRRSPASTAIRPSRTARPARPSALAACCGSMRATRSPPRCAGSRQVWRGHGLLRLRGVNRRAARRCGPGFDDRQAAMLARCTGSSRRGRL